MADKLLARVILYTDGTVHFAIDSRRTFCCTPSALQKFMQDPINFIRSGVLQLPETTDLINPQRRKLEKVGFLSLIYLDNKKEVSVRFPEVFQFIASLSQEDWNKPLDMSSHIQRASLSDTKAFLLNFYIKFTQSIDKEARIENYLDINREVFYDVLREIFNSVFFFEKEDAPAVRLDDVVNDVKQKLLIEDEPDEEADNMITVSEYASKYGLRRNAVLNFIHDKKLHAQQVGREYLLDAGEEPPLSEQQQRNKEKKESTVRQQVERRRSVGVAVCEERNWSHQELKQYIANNKFFSPVVANYILSWDEFLLYRDDFRECCVDNIHFLIKDINVDLVDKNGVSNRERMKAGRPPVTLSPDGHQESMELHHLAQRGECYAMLDKHFHQKHYSVLHQNTPSDTEQHDAIFDSIKKKFWKWYVQQYEIKNSFDGIKYIFPKVKKKG